MDCGGCDTFPNLCLWRHGGSGSYDDKISIIKLRMKVMLDV